MFETNYRNSIPGYTGHLSTKVENDVPLINKEARKHIPGMVASISINQLHTLKTIMIALTFNFIYRLRWLPRWC